MLRKQTMIIIKRKFKQLEDELEANTSISKPNKVKLKQLLSDEYRKAQAMYHILSGQEDPAMQELNRGSICHVLNIAMSGTLQMALQTSEKEFRAQMLRCINENHQNTQGSISNLSQALDDINVAGPEIKKSHFQARTNDTPHHATVREGVSGVIKNYEKLFFTPRDTTRDRSMLDTVVGRAVQDTCAIVQAATFLPKITIVAVVSASDTVQEAAHRVGAAIATTPIAQAYVTARDAFTARVEQNHGVAPVWTEATVDDLAAFATFRAPRLLKNSNLPRSLSLSTSTERSLFHCAEAEASVASDVLRAPSSLSISIAKRHHLRSKTCKPSSHGDGNGESNRLFSKKLTTKTTQITEEMAPGFTQVREKQVKTLETFEHGKKTKTIEKSESSTTHGCHKSHTLNLNYTRSAQKELDKLESIYQTAVTQRIEKLKAEPFPVGVEKMFYSDKNYYRVRQGNYRIIYAVENGAIHISDIGHRKEVYQRR